MEYQVVWRVDVEAPTPEKAAQQARDIQREAGTLADTFEVLPFLGGDMITVQLDLSEEF